MSRAAGSVLRIQYGSIINCDIIHDTIPPFVWNVPVKSFTGKCPHIEKTPAEEVRSLSFHFFCQANSSVRSIGV